MRFMIMHKNDPHTEAGQLPPMELIAKVGAFMGEHAQAGRLVDGAGLGASKTRTRLVFRDGNCTVKHGPYRGEHELPAATLLLKVRTREEAIGWAERYGKILGDGEIELGKINEPWDIGMMPPPENPPLQILLIEKADAATDATERAGYFRQAAKLASDEAAAGVPLFIVTGHTAFGAHGGGGTRGSTRSNMIFDGLYITKGRVPVDGVS